MIDGTDSNNNRTYVYDSQGDRKDLLITAVPDFSQLTVDAITPFSGAWPPASGEILLERLALEYLDVAIGDTLFVELEDGATKPLKIVGTAHNPQQFSPIVFKRTSGYVEPETMDKMGFGTLYPQMRVRLDPDLAPGRVDVVSSYAV